MDVNDRPPILFTETNAENKEKMFARVAELVDALDLGSSS